MVRVLLDAGHAVDFGGIDADTPLSYACLSDSVECATLLLAFGADIMLTFFGRPSPRELAQSNGIFELVNLLDATQARREAQALEGSVLRSRPSACRRL